MMELFRHVGPNTDVPAGDIGVGGREEQGQKTSASVSGGDLGMGGAREDAQTPGT